MMLRPPEKIAAIQALVARDPDFVSKLSAAQVMALRYDSPVWLRPEQHLRGNDWAMSGIIAGRGWGKTEAIACEINRRVREEGVRYLALMGPTEDRIEEVQIKMLIETAPPWFRPERCRGGLRWPNGAFATLFTAEAPQKVRGDNIAIAWLCEIVAWQPTTRMLAFDNLMLAVRRGTCQVFWDTTSQGANDVILKLLRLHAADPNMFRLARGGTYDNPALPKKYLASLTRLFPKGTRRHDEEIIGLVFAESAGALWKKEWINRSRVDARPTDEDLILVSLDPAHSTHIDADDTGIMVGSRSKRRHAYVFADESGRHAPEAWGDIVVKWHLRGAAGVVVERRGLGDHVTANIRARAKNHDVEVRVLERGEPFPRYTRGVLYVREEVGERSKGARAEAPASETEAGRVHIVGSLDALELELTTYEPGVTRESPNRFDACAYLVSELLELTRERPSAAAAEDMRAALVANERLGNATRAVMARTKRLGI